MIGSIQHCLDRWPPFVANRPNLGYFLAIFMLLDLMLTEVGIPACVTATRPGDCDSGPGSSDLTSEGDVAVGPREATDERRAVSPETRYVPSPSILPAGFARPVSPYWVLTKFWVAVVIGAVPYFLEKLASRSARRRGNPRGDRARH